MLTAFSIRPRAAWRIAPLLVSLMFLAQVAALRADPQIPDPASVQSKLAALEATLHEKEQAVVSTRPGYRKAYDAVEALGVTADDARNAAAGKVEALPEKLRPVLASVQPAVKAHNASLEAYFAAYDDWSSLRMDAKALEVVARLKEARDAFKGTLGDSELSKLDGLIAAVNADAGQFWEHRNVIQGRESWRRYADLRRMSQGDRAAETEIERLKQKTGASQKPALAERVKRSLHRTKRFWENMRLKMSLKIPSAKIMAYLMNPLVKRDPDKVSSLLREMGQSYVSGAKIDLEVIGRENLPKDRTLIVTPSHRNVFIDPFSMFNVTSGPLTVVQTILWFPSWAQEYVKKLTANEPGIILAHTDGVDVIGKSVETVKAGRTLLFFPEGNIPSPLGEIRRMRSGLDTIAEKVLEQPVAIAPVTILDPVDQWGVPGYGDTDRDLGIKVKIVFDKAVDPRVMFALSHGEERLMLNVLRESYHKNLIPALADPASLNGASREEFAGQTDERQNNFEKLYSQD